MAYRSKPTAEKIADLEKKEAQIRAQLNREKSKLKDDERKRDTRRKIIVGALALEHKDSTFQETLRRLLNQYVTKPHDRALFDLPPLPEQETPPPS